MKSQNDRLITPPVGQFVPLNFNISGQCPISFQWNRTAPTRSAETKGRRRSIEKPFEPEFLTGTSARGLRHIDNYLGLEEEKPVYDLLEYITSDSLARFLFGASFAVLPIVCCTSSMTVRAMPPNKKPKVEKGQRFLTGFKGFEKDSAGNESASVGISEDSDHSQSESVPSPPPQALSEGDAPATAGKPKVEQETTRVIVDAWFKLFPWLTYDKEEKVMRCTVCMEDKVAKNSFTRGCSNFRKSALTEHAATLDHRNALKTPVHRSNQEEVAKNVLTKEENGIAQAVKAVHWIVSEDLPLSKYDSFMSLMAEYEVTDVDKLKVSESASYTSRYTANDILEVLAEDVDAQAGKQLDESRLLSVLADETTDITVRKRMGIDLCKNPRQGLCPIHKISHQTYT